MMEIGHIAGYVRQGGSLFCPNRAETGSMIGEDTEYEQRMEN